MLTPPWLRSIGGVVFIFGGVVPLVWFILSRGTKLVREVDVEDSEWTAYGADWAAERQAGVGGR